ncbi:MAG: hypothetical protein M9938_09880 [Solirubrobacterales bacterium]|nr:hypothetical protein [Solirubrobacterales bacterium]
MKVASLGSAASQFWNDQLVEHQRELVFLVLVGFLVSFIAIRASTRLMRSPKVPWWPGSIVSDSGLHVHHLVFGIITMMLSGALGFADQGESALSLFAAFGFGVGIGLTIDEFALWLHLDDVYWSEEGRRSIDATVIIAVFLGMVLLGVRPFEVVSDSPEALVASLLLAGMVIWWAVICVLKDRILHALLGFFIWPFGAYGAARLAKPNSRWAKKRYGERNPGKQARAEKRFRPGRRTDRFKEWFRDLVGGGLSDADR